MSDRLTAKGPQVSNSLSLAVTDFGPITAANIELRPLTVFVGPSNTGKSYLAALIYALHRFFAGNTQQDSWDLGSSISLGSVLRQGGAELMSEAALLEAFNLATEVTERVKAENPAPVAIPEEVRTWVRSVFAGDDGRLALTIRRCFGMDDLGALIRKGGKRSAQVSLRRAGLADASPMEHTLSLRKEGARLTMAVPDAAPLPTGSGNSRAEWVLRVIAQIGLAHDRAESGTSVLRVFGVLDSFLTPYLAGPLSVPAYYLPADRTGVMHAHSVVVNAVTEAAALTGLRPAPERPLLSGVMADFLKQLMTIGQDRVRRDATQDLGGRIEETVLGGAVRIGKSAAGNAPRFLYRPSGWKEDLPLLSSSSMVSDLAPLVLYLRHVVGPGEVLILEEPESHLHPEAQSALAREIVRLVAGGLRVLVTTHSDWMLHQFANQVRLSGLEAERREGLDKTPELRPDQFGAWLFRPTKRPRGSVVKEIPFDPDRGGFETGYGDVADALYRDWAEIGNRIAEGKASGSS